MNKSMLAMTFLALLALPLGAGTPRSLPPDLGPGRVVWFDLTTTDLARSKAFYGPLFNWEFAAVTGTTYAVQIVCGGSTIGTLRVAEGKITPYNGVVYVQVADILASGQKVKELGGTVVPGFPFNLSDGAGAISLVNDPVGHPIGLFSRTPIPPTK